MRLRSDLSSRVLRPMLLLAAMLSLAACGRDTPAPAAPAADVAGTAPAEAAPVAALPQGSLEAVALELGTRLDADGRVAITAERVRPSEAVHVSLVTVGEAEAAMLGVHWRDAAGVELASDERAITATGPAVHTFTRQPETPWAPGRYEVEVTMNGESAGVRTFDVR